MKKGVRDHIYSGTRLVGNLLQDKKKKIVVYVMYVIPHISNRIWTFFENYPTYVCRAAKRWQIFQKNENGEMKKDYY